MHLAKYLFKTAALYGTFAALFSLIGLILPYAEPPDNPLSSLSLEHVAGHIIFGMMAGFATLKFRYIIVSGLFAIILDADHLVNFAGLDMVSRMGHSIPFAIIIPILIMATCGKKDYLLGVVSFSAVFSHMAFDTLLGTGDFPIFVPFNNYITAFSGTDWILLQLVAVIPVIIITITKRSQIQLRQ